MEKRAEFGFVWFFAIVAGIAILVLAIYGATKFGDVSETENQATIAKKISILTDPLEAGFTSATFGTITFQTETEIKNVCDPSGFGRNSISARTKTEINTGKSEFSIPVSSSEKYIFSRDVDSGNSYYVLSKSFDFPFKIADYVILVSDSQNYCFKDAPEEVFEELSSLKIPIIHFDNCSRADSDMTVVCFGTEGCDVSVIGECQSCQDLFARGTVITSNGDSVPYVGNLLYAAIFSDTYNYECNVDRLLYRGSLTSRVLTRKAELMNARSCNTNLQPVLATWSGLLDNATFEDLHSMHPQAIEMDDAAKWEVCGVW
jgi:hypothetical protein